MPMDDDEKNADELNDATTPYVKAVEPAEPKKPIAVLDPFRTAGTPGARKPGQPMFGNFEAAKKRKPPPWAIPLFVSLLAFEGVGFAAGWIKSIWDIERLDLQRSSFDLAVAPAPPPPPPPPPGGAKPHEVQITPKKVRVKELTQPVKQEKMEQKAPEVSGDPNGVEGGEVGGVAGGVVGGDINGVAGAPPPPPPPPPPPAAPTNVPPTMLEGSRISGEKMISPDDVTKTEISRSGKDKIVGSFKICLDVNGGVSSVTMLKSTGFTAYDGKIQGKMRGEWRYRPYMVNGKSVPVCTAVTFIYSQK